MTQKLYWKTPYATKFTAKVKAIKEKGIVLDKTLFYPESGNQISDRGYFYFKDLKIKVNHIIKEGEEILHQVSNDNKSYIKIGDEIEGEIDWKYRYGIMKAHTSQHIFSAIIKSKYDIDTERANLSFEDVFIKITPNIEYEKLKKILTEVNKICNTYNLKIHSKIIPRKEAIKISDKIRSTIPDESNIRLMEIEGLDLVCCGGTHVKNTGEIGSLFIYEFKRGNEIRYFVGKKALEMSSSLNLDLISLANDINSPIKKMNLLLKKRLKHIESLKEKNKELSIKLLESISKSPYKVINRISLFYIDFDVNIKILNNSLKNFPPNSLIIVIFEANKIRILSLHEKIDANQIVQKLIEKYGGKGGGHPKSSQCFLEKVPKTILAEIESQILKF